MSRPRKIPAYRRHKQSGQAVVTLTDPAGDRRDVLLGEYGTVASWQKYAFILAEWTTADCRLTTENTFGGKLQSIRQQAGVSAARLAQTSGIPLGTIRAYEQNRREPLFTHAAKLAQLWESR